MKDWRGVVVGHLTVQSLVSPHVSRGLVEVSDDVWGQDVPDDEVARPLELRHLRLAQVNVGGRLVRGRRVGRSRIAHLKPRRPKGNFLAQPYLT